MTTDEERAAVAEAVAEAPPATYEDWIWLLDKAEELTVPRCILELRQRVEALEAAGGVAGNPGHASVAPAVLTVDELADCLPANAWAGPEGYSRQAFARHLLDHPRIGPLLRGEGAGVPKRVVLPEEPPDKDPPVWMDNRQAYAWCCGRSSAWADLVTEMVRQQQGGQADG